MSLALLLCVVLGGAAPPPSGAANLGAPPHGGLLAPTSEGQLELVVEPDRLALYPLDARLQLVPLGDAEAQLIGVDGATLPLAPATDHWEAKNPYGTSQGLTLVAVVRRASGSTAARFELLPGQGAMFHDHRPFHGGQVGMAGDRHLELALVPTKAGAELQLFLTDAFRQPEPLDGISGTLTIEQGGHSATHPLVPAGDCFTVEQDHSRGPVAVQVHLVYPRAPEEVDMDFRFDQSAAAEAGQRPVKILVGANGFSPSRVDAPAGRPLTLRFFRTTDETCAKEVVFPSIGVQRELPLHHDVDVALVPTRGEIAFSCGMGMVTGAVVAH